MSASHNGSLEAPTKTDEVTQQPVEAMPTDPSIDEHSSEITAPPAKSIEHLCRTIRPSCYVHDILEEKGSAIGNNSCNLSTDIQNLSGLHATVKEIPDNNSGGVATLKMTAAIANIEGLES